MTSTVAIFDTYQTEGYAGILAASGAFVAVGSPFVHETRMLTITNNTDGDMAFSNDGVNNQIFVAAYTARILDMTTNRQNNSSQWVVPANTQWYVAYISAPSKGSVYVESIYGKGE